jgi:hypothetical protein
MVGGRRAYYLKSRGQGIEPGVIVDGVRDSFDGG